MGQVAGIRQAGTDIFAGQTRVVRKQLFLRLSGGQKLKDKFRRQPRSPNQWLARQYVGIYANSFTPVHVPQNTLVPVGQKPLRSRMKLQHRVIRPRIPKRHPKRHPNLAPNPIPRTPQRLPQRLRHMVFGSG